MVLIVWAVKVNICEHGHSRLLDGDGGVSSSPPSMNNESDSKPVL